MMRLQVLLQILQLNDSQLDEDSETAGIKIYIQVGTITQEF